MDTQNNPHIIIKIIIILLAAAAFAGVYYWMKKSPEENHASPLNYKDISYKIDGKDVYLKDGIRYFGNEVRADFNGDGKEDIAFLLTWDGGGSGTFYYAAAALRTGSGYKGTDAVFLGDRIAPQTTEFRDGEIIVNYADRKPDEPMTTRPSVGVSKYLKIDGGNLIEAR